MKKKNQKLPARFSRETRYNLAPVLRPPFRTVEGAEFEKLKSRLLQRLLDNVVQTELSAPLRRAANDASALAWTTPFPALFFPTLLEEKARCARLQFQKQNQVRLRSALLLVEAA
ncbi:MAG: hypothetical protein ABIP71_15485 [Verrucomicrobiota bacterium]